MSDGLRPEYFAMPYDTARAATAAASATSAMPSSGFASDMNFVLSDRLRAQPAHRHRPFTIIASIVVISLLAWTAHRVSRRSRALRLQNERAASVRLPPDVRRKAASAAREFRRRQVASQGGEPTAKQRAAQELSRIRGLCEPFSWSGMLALADIYARGVYPFFAPDEACAEGLYRECSRSPDPEIAGLAQQKFIDLRLGNGAVIGNEDRADGSRPVPRSVADAAKRAAQAEVDAIARREGGSGSAAAAATETPVSGWYQRRPRWTARSPVVRVPTRATYASALASASASAPRPTRPATATFLRTLFTTTTAGNANAHGQVFTPNDHDAPPQQDAHRVDSQNVHDHTVARTVKRNLENVRGLLKPDDRIGGREAVEQATDFLLTSDVWNGDQKADALDVLDSLNDSANTSAGMSQLDAMSAVWSAIHRITCDRKRQNVRETLIDQIRSAKENGNVVCSTGRIARIAGALEGIDEPDIGADVETAKPMWAVRQEIANLAYKVRSDFEKKAGADAEAADAPDSAAAAAFRRMARSRYVDELKFSEAVMAPLINEFAEHI